MTRHKRDRSIRDTRDIEIAAFLEEHAAAVRNGLSISPNRMRYPEEIRGPLVTALNGLASSIRAGLVESELDGRGLD